MAPLLGFVLLTYSACTFFTLRLLFFHNSDSSHTSILTRYELPTGPRSRKATILAALAVVALWWFEGRYRRVYSPEAQARDKFEEVLTAWEAGDRRKASSILDSLAHNERPWDQSTDDTDE